MSRYPLFDRRLLQLRPLVERGHDLTADAVLPLSRPHTAELGTDFFELLLRIRAARQQGFPVVLMMGGHPIKLGLSRYLIDLMERGWVTHLATNGAGLIHDFELALVGGTSENVPKWIQAGQFGLWKETGRINAILQEGAEAGEGLGEALGRVIETEGFPNRHLSIAAAGWRLGIPVTSHVTIGGDIIHAHQNCEGWGLGQTSYTDFLIFAASVSRLCTVDDVMPWRPALSDAGTLPQVHGGVYLNVGTAVTGPEVYLKALSMARNVAHQRNETIRHFTTGVFDLVPLPVNWRCGTPPKDDPYYYYRPWKTILMRTVADGGESFYVQADHRESLPHLWSGLVGS